MEAQPPLAPAPAISAPVKLPAQRKKVRGRGGRGAQPRGTGASSATRLPVQAWDLLHGDDQPCRIPAAVVADAYKADEATAHVFEDDAASSFHSSSFEERSVMAGVTKDSSPTDDVVYNSDAVKSALMDSHAVVLDDCNRMLKDRKAAFEDADADDADFASPPRVPFPGRPGEGDVDRADSSCGRGSASQRAADAASMNRLAQGVDDDLEHEQSLHFGAANAAGRGAGDGDIEAKFGLCVSKKAEVDWIVSQHASQTGGHWETHGGGSNTCAVYIHKGPESSFRASSNFVRIQKYKRKVLHPCYSTTPSLPCFFLSHH
jgi:hypothetical protein